MEVGFWGYLIATGIAAFAAAIAGVVVGAVLDRRARRREARTLILQAISRHIDRLWGYASVCAQVQTAGAGNLRTNSGQTLPGKPSIHALVAELESVRPILSQGAQGALNEAVKVAVGAGVDTYPGAISDWERESAELGGLASTVARWDGKSATLPGATE